MTKTIILYHARCTDGAAAMWSAWKYFGNNADYIPVGKESKRSRIILNICLEADNVFMCDCMLSPEYIGAIARADTIVHLLDHHISNIEAWNEYLAQPENFDIRPNIRDFTDLTRSGGGLTWDHFHSEKGRPAIIDYVEDLDLWNNTLPDYDSVLSYLRQFVWRSNELIIEKFEEFEQLSPAELVARGKPLDEYKKNLIEKNLSQVMRAKVKVIMPTAQSRMVFTFNVPILNTNHFLDETGNIMAEGESFSIIWQLTSSGEVRASLRSKPGGEDMSKICISLGHDGGGHMHSGGTRFNNLEDMLEHIEFIST